MTLQNAAAPVRKQRRSKKIGSQKPRLEYPKSGRIRSNAPGDEAIEIVKVYGTTLDPWQEYLLRRLMAERQGKYQFRDVLLSAPRRQGKTELIFARCKVALILTNEKLVYTSITLDSARLLFRKLETWINADPELKAKAKINRGKGSEMIEMPEGGSIRFLARNDTASRGDGCDILIYDEAQKMDEDEFSAMDPLLADSPNPQAIFFGTPAMEKDVATSKFASLRKAVLEGNDPYSYLAEWSAEENADPSAEATWIQANPAYNIRNVDFDSMHRAYLRNSTQKFYIERLGGWGAVMHKRIIEDAHWMSMRTDEHSPKPQVLALEVSPDTGNGSRATVCSAALRPDGLPHVDVLRNAEGSQWVRSYLIEKSKELNVPVIIDSGSVAAGEVVPLRAAGVTVHDIGTQQVKQAASNFVTTVENSGIKHFDQIEFNLSVAGAAKRKIGDGFGFAPSSDAVDITPVQAASFALFGLSLLQVKAAAVPVKKEPQISTTFFGSSSSNRWAGRY